MRNSDRGVGTVDVLSPSAGSAEGVDTEVVGADVDLDVIGFGEDRDGGSGCVYAALGFGLGDPLNAVGTGLPFEGGVDAVAADHGDEFFEPAGATGGGGEEFNTPSALGGVAAIHIEEVGGEECGLVAPGSCADFHDDIFPIERVGGEHQEFELLLELFDPRFGCVEFLFGEVAHLWIAEEFTSLFGACAEVLPFLPRLYEFTQRDDLFVNFGVAFMVGEDGGIFELTVQLLIAVGDVLKALKHKTVCVHVVASAKEEAYL